MALAPAPADAGMMPPDPTAGADPTAAAPDSGDTTVVTIAKTADGSYMVYAGDEPDSDDSGGDMSGDDAGAMSDAAGGAPATGGGATGQPADSIGAALKIAMDILNSDKSSEGAPGNADDQMSAGFSASKYPTPASGPSQKY